MAPFNRRSPLFLAFLLFQFCTHEEPLAPTTQTVQFTLDLHANHRTELPAGSAVVLTITTSSGEDVLTDHVVAIHPSDEGFITEPISLAAGQYVITEFMVVHDDAALYVTPKAGSELSAGISTPLSHPLSLRDVRVVSLELVETKNHTAEKFGYRSLKLKNTSAWKIMAFTRENGVLERTAAWAYLIAPGIAYGSILQPEMNTLEFSGDPQRSYTLQVEKAGYVTYTTAFVYDNIPGNGNKPFKVILERLPDENSFRITPPGAEGEFTFRLGVRGTGSLVVDWGDGTIETLSFAPDPTAAVPNTAYISPSHEYAYPIPNEVSITGDLDQIFVYESISVYVSGLDPRNLSGLQTFSLEGAAINGLLDLSSNSQLESVSLIEETYAWEIRLPENHEIKEVALSSSSGLAQSVVDLLIENIHRNAITNNIKSGTVTIVPPLELSSQSAEKVQDLVDNYGWQLL